VRVRRSGTFPNANLYSARAYLLTFRFAYARTPLHVDLIQHTWPDCQQQVHRWGPGRDWRNHSFRAVRRHSDRPIRERTPPVAPALREWLGENLPANWRLWLPSGTTHAIRATGPAYLKGTCGENWVLNTDFPKSLEPEAIRVPFTSDWNRSEHGPKDGAVLSR
jgi:hypothetical protein